MLRRFLAVPAPFAARCISSTSAVMGVVKQEGVPNKKNMAKRAMPELNGTIDQFFPTMSVVDGKTVKRAAPVVGGDWKAWMLRNKSTEDLHKLWYVLLKERNALLTEQAECHARNLALPNPYRKSKVRKSMARIKLVLHERSLIHQANAAKKSEA
ncbi:mitochondrial 39-S ribosomal protein L47 [Achlya hypogyna]|uniref:Large ribosomal subunit protein uL29m n=1 Tax=Achlya hypogyna TaxID=1202772 RepID=A0A1V9YQL7_ACHHY|nr:mitochondrial 39-S ribosomal protein L47 [Achlya hypogyna]